MCYLAGADLARDLAGELGERGFTVITHTAYRMIPVPSFPDDVTEAFRTGGVKAVLHFSRRSARAFLGAARAGGVEISALALPQYCISDAVGMILRDAGTMQVAIAREPNENALLDAFNPTQLDVLCARSLQAINDSWTTPGLTRGMRELIRLIGRLPHNQQEVIRLKFQNGFSYQEISRITSLSVTNVGFILHTAIKALRREMTAQPE